MPPTLDAIIAELAAMETLPADVLRTLAARRLEVVRQGLTRGGGIDVARLTGTAARNPFVEAAGAPRVEFDLRP
jgi:acyl-CoA reductase-like NAD-dependent aldehyde dehydrogenase